MRLDPLQWDIYQILIGVTIGLIISPRPATKCWFIWKFGATVFVVLALAEWWDRRVYLSQCLESC